MAAQHSTTADFSSRYKFNSLVPTTVGSKELDRETGWYYYGARYYDPQVSTWLSVDPLAEKYAGFSPYNFTLGNPVKLVDPDGRGLEDEWIVFSTGETKRIGDKGGDKTDYITKVNKDGSITSITQAAGKMKETLNLNDNKYDGAGPLEFTDELLAGGEAVTKNLKNGGGYLVYSTAKHGKGAYWKPDARGLNNLKGVSANVNKIFKYGGPAVATLLEVPEIVDGYNQNIHEGNKQIAGAVGSVGGGWLGGVAAGATLGLAGIETGPGVFVTVAIGAVIGGFIGEEGVERLYDKITGHD